MTVAPTQPRHPAASALLNLAVQLLLLTAIPLALWKLSGTPVPRRIPSWTDIQIQWRGIEAQPSQLVEPVLRIMADVLWIVWAWYAAWTVTALIWILLRLPHMILPGALTAITPAIAFRALSLGALATHPATPVHSASAAAAPAAPASIHPTATSSGTQRPGEAMTVDIVEPGDNLWNLAERYYHQGEDWHEIYDANRGVEQPGGGSLTNPELIQPGWHLDIPGVPTPTASGSAPPNTRPAPAPSHGPTAVQPAPSHSAPVAPRTTIPHTTTATPTRTSGGVSRPAPDRPRTVGLSLPDDAGYIGITLTAAIAASVAILRTRNRHRDQPKNHDIPDLAQHLATVHSLARSAQVYGFDPDDHPDMDAPPLYEPLDRQVTIGTSPDGRSEIPFNPDTLSGPLVLTGPGAQDAARALAISTLATGHTLDGDPEVATNLLGTPSPAQPEDPAPGVTSLRPAKAAEDGLGSVIVNAPSGEDASGNDATVIEVEADGTVTGATGPDAEEYTGARIHSLAADAAATLHETLEDARPAPAPGGPQTSPGTLAKATTDSGDPTNPGFDLRALVGVPVIVQILGEVLVHGPATAQPIRMTAERPAALVTLLALHQDGISPRTLHEREWASAPDQRRARIALNTAINRVRAPLRAALDDSASSADLVYLDKATGNYRLNPEIVTSDLAVARDLAAQANTTAEIDTKVRLLIQAAALYRGPLAPRIDDRNRDWLTTARYMVLNDAIALHLHVADLTAEIRPDATAHHLVSAVELAPEDQRTILVALQVCRRIHKSGLARDLYRRHAGAMRALGEAPNAEAEQLLAEITGRRVRT